MVRVTKFGGLVFSVLATATSGCSSDSTNVDHAASGNTGTSGNQGGSVSTSGGTGGTGNATGGAGLVGVSTSTGTNGGTNGAGASTAAASGGATSGGATSGATPNSGVVWVVSVLSNQSILGQVATMFYTGALKRCSSQTFGDCIYYTNCSLPPAYVSAGTLAITSTATATLPANDITMVPNADNTYTDAPLSGTFAGGETVHIAASGATVPSFSVDLTAPLALLINSPATDSYGTIQASRSSDLVIQFSRGTTGVALVVLPLDFDTSTEYVECTSEPGASSLTIPKAALAVAGRELTLLSVTTKEIVAGDYAVSAGIYMNAFTPDKQHPVTIEIN